MLPRKRLFIVFCVLLACLFLIGGAYAMSSPNYALDWYTPMNSSGGGECASTNYTAEFTVGQTAVGRTGSPGHRAHFGYWVDEVTRWMLQLPLLMRGTP